MIALSVRQPWVWFILRPDLVGEAARAAAAAAFEIKDVENRSRRTKYRGPLLLHASKGGTRIEHEAAEALARERCGFTGVLPAWEELPRGGIVGSVTVVDCVASSTSPWFVGQETGGFGIVLRSPRPLPFFPVRGQLSLFEVSLPEEMRRLAA